MAEGGFVDLLACVSETESRGTGWPQAHCVAEANPSGPNLPISLLMYEGDRSVLPHSALQQIELFIILDVCKCILYVMSVSRRGLGISWNWSLQAVVSCLMLVGIENCTQVLQKGSVCS